MSNSKWKYPAKPCVHCASAVNTHAHSLSLSVDAETEFQDMDRSSANHWHRTEYSKFLVLTGRTDVAQEKLNTLLEEFDLMRAGERRVNSSTIREVKELVAKINA